MKGIGSDARDSLRRLPDRVRLPIAFDPGPLEEELAGIAQSEWTAHPVADNHDGGWNAAALRAPAGETHPIRMISVASGAGRYVDTPLLARCPRLAEVVARFRCELELVRLMRLEGGSVIREHRDPDLDAACGMARLHLPIATGPGVDFRVSGRRVDMQPGSVWYLRLSEPHSVVNRGDAPRVHLVLDALVDDWLAGLLLAGDPGD